jgi:hypothetical protein
MKTGAGVSDPRFITDHHGRVWVREGLRYPTYVHCGMRWVRESVEDTQHGLPSQEVLDNQNYAELCSICLGGRQRHVAAQPDEPKNN